MVRAEFRLERIICANVDTEHRFAPVFVLEFANVLRAVEDAHFQARAVWIVAGNDLGTVGQLCEKT